MPPVQQHSLCPPVYLFLFVSPTSSTATQTEWGTLWRKLTAPANLTYDYYPAFDLACLGILAALVLWGLVRAHATVNRVMIGPLALLSVAFLLMPDQLFTSYGADKRLTIAIALVAIAALEWRAWNQWVLVSLAALFIVRVALITEVWAKSDAVYGEYLAAIERMPDGAKLLVVVADTADTLPPIPAFEIANLAIIYRRAFVPSLFHFPKDAATAVAFSPDMQKLAEATPPHIVRPDMLKALQDREYANRKGPFRPELLSQYDYVLIAHPNELPVEPPSGAKLFEGRDFILLKAHE